MPLPVHAGTLIFVTVSDTAAIGATGASCCDVPAHKKKTICGSVAQGGGALPTTPGGRKCHPYAALVVVGREYDFPALGRGWEMGMRYIEFALGLAAGCVAGWLWAIRPGLLAEIEWLNAMTAFGTLGTAVFSAAFAVTTYRQQRRQSRLLAQSYASTSISVVVSLMHRASDLVAKLVDPIESEARPTALEIIGHIDSMAEDLRKIDIGALSAVSPEIVAYARAATIDLSNARLKITRSRVDLDGCVALLGDFFKDLKSVLLECGRVSKPS